MVKELSDTRRVFVLLSRVFPGALWTRSASLSLKLNALFVKPCSALRSTSSPPPFCGPHGVSTPGESWKRAEAPETEAHKSP